MAHPDAVGLRSIQAPGGRTGAKRARLCGVVLAAALTGCSFSSAARLSSDRLKEGWDVDEQGYGVVLTGPASTLRAAGDLAYYSVFSPSKPEVEPNEKWFRFYDGPMQPIERVAILCHLERTTHVATIRRSTESVAAEARYEPWHYPRCIEVLPGEYELTVSYYSRRTRSEGLTATTTTTESTVPSTTHWAAQPGEVYVLTAVVGRPAPAPGAGPSYSVRPRTKQLWDSEFKLEVSHWQAAIVKLASRQQLELPVETHRERWRQYEDGH